MADFSVNVNGLVLSSAQDVQAALKAGKITQAQANAYAPLFPAATEKPAGGTEVEHREAQPEDAEKAKASATANQKAANDAAANKYFADTSGLLKDDLAKGLLFSMTEAMTKGNKKAAAEYYARLDEAGIFKQEGVNKPPYADELTPIIEQAKREAIANEVVQDVNTRKGQERLRDSLRGMDEKSEVQQMGKDAGLEKVHGAGGIAKANRKNAEHVERQLNLQTVFVEGKTYNIDGKEMTAKEAYEHTKKALGDEWNKKQPQAQLMSEEGYNVAKKLDEAAQKAGVSILNEDGSINIEKAQGVARGIVSITGDRGDRNEMQAIAKELGVEEKDVKAFLRGLNVDYKKDRTWLAHTLGGVAGAGAATAALATDFLTGGVGKAISYIIPGATHTVTNNTQIIDNNSSVVIDNTIASNGEVFTDITEDFSSTTTFVNGKPVVTQDPDTPKTIPGKKPHKTFGDWVGAAAMGYTVYDLTSKVLRNVFNKDEQILHKGKSVADALDDPKALKGKPNQDVMTMISNFKFDPKHNLDEATQKQIKLALLEEAMGNAQGGKLNKRELSGVLAALDSINNSEIATQPSTPTTSTPTTSTPTTSTPTTSTPTEEKPCMEKEDDVTKDVNIKHRSGMGPYQYAEALGIPAKYRQEFIAQFRADNNMTKDGKTFNKTPLIQKDYTFKDGTTIHVGKDSKEVQDKVDKYNLKPSKPKPGAGKQTWKAVNGREVRVIDGRWVYCDTHQPVSQEDYDKWIKGKLD